MNKQTKTKQHPNPSIPICELENYVLTFYKNADLSIARLTM